MPVLQDIIHNLEVGGGKRHLVFCLVFLGVVLFAGGYDLRAFRNFSTQEAMDSAQLARNISDGKGYTTHFVRPFSMYLLRRHYIASHGAPPAGQLVDMEQVKGMHPDLANPPVYPLLLAGTMKMLGKSSPFAFKYDINRTRALWSPGGDFYRYKPDFMIALINQGLFCLLVVLVFYIARFLFDPSVAWLSAVVLFGTELMWRFTVSGLSTILLSLIFTGLIGCLALIEREGREPKWRPGTLFWLAAASGALTGIGALTRYSIAWVILPVVVFLLLFCGRRRYLVALLSLLVFGAVLAPWLIRNYHLSGTIFGVAGYTALEHSPFFPDTLLQRSLEPDFSHINLLDLRHKLFSNLRPVICNELPRLGGSWVAAFFLVGLMVGFRNLAIRRLRYFMMGCIGLFVILQCLGRTQLSEDSPDINSENLFVLLTPMVLVYGVSLFYVLLEQINYRVSELRYVVMLLFLATAYLPALLAVFPLRNNAVSYPPYYPPAFNGIAKWLKEGELTMSDVPWAMAWYGDRQCVWLTLNCKRDFLAVNDVVKHVVLLLLTPRTLQGEVIGFARSYRSVEDAQEYVDKCRKEGQAPDPKLLERIDLEKQTWNYFCALVEMHGVIPEEFPLTKMPLGWLPDHVVLTDWRRWEKPQK
jgi:4-amino-4-deoxy-L-arabinose transferase-like glycosyltransferase